MFKDSKSGQTHSFGDGCGEPAHNTPEKWEEEFHHLFEILTDSGKNIVNGRDDFEYWSFHDSLKSFIRHAISEAVEEERRYISSKVVDTLTTVWAPKTEEDKKKL